MIHEDEEHPPQSITTHENTLANLQKMLRDWGPGHFDPTGSNPLFYFQILVLSQQFEQAVEYLSQFPDYSVEVVHLALILYHYGALNPPQKLTADAMLRSDLYIDGPPPQINIVRLLRPYVGRFAGLNPRDALHYFRMLHDESVKMACIEEMLLETKEFEFLIGSLSFDANVPSKPGLIEKVFKSRDAAFNLAARAAHTCESQGRYDDAIKLYFFCEHYDEMLRVLNDSLSRWLTLSGPERNQLIELGLNVYHNVPRIHSERQRRTLEQLLQLMHFFDLYSSHQMDTALQSLQQLDLLPFNNEDVHRKAANFKRLDIKVQQNIAEILLAAMTIIYQNFQHETTKARQNELRRIADALLVFAGMIKYKMGADTTTRLMHMKVYMGPIE